MKQDISPKEQAAILLDDAKKSFSGSMAQTICMLKINEKVATLIELYKELSDSVSYWNDVYKELIELK